VIFKGAGERAFSAGADITEFGTAPSYVESRRADGSGTYGGSCSPWTRF
jgi:enoyl-CoA hydratase/carnithine racemase